jgi:hypothetical protein
MSTKAFIKVFAALSGVLRAQAVPKYVLVYCVVEGGGFIGTVWVSWSPKFSLHYVTKKIKKLKTAQKCLPASKKQPRKVGGFKHIYICRKLL